SLKESVAEGVRAAATAIEPVVQNTLDGLSRNASALDDTIRQSVQQQLDGLSSRFDASSVEMAEIWKAAVAEHQQSNASLGQRFRSSLDGFAQSFEQRSAGLLEGVSSRMEKATVAMSQAWDAALDRHESASGEIAGS